MRVLVTGGAGYIGSHTCKALAEAGHTPITYDNMVAGNQWAVQWGPLEVGDILDRPRLDAVIRKYKPEVVVHFAAYAYVGESVTDPGKYYRNNVVGSLTLLEAMRDHNIPHIVFSSTCATYGVPPEGPISEATPQKPINPYGMTKFVVEAMLKDFEEAHGLNWVALRYFNAAGADPLGRIGESHSPETHLIPLALEAAGNKKKPLTIFGIDHNTPDGTCIRDYIHVDDLADAHVRAVDRLALGMKSMAINLGNGKGYSILDVIEAVSRVSGKPVAVNNGPRRPGDPSILVSDARLAREVLGWSPGHTSLDDIVETAWNWHKKTPKRSAISVTPSKAGSRERASRR